MIDDLPASAQLGPGNGEPTKGRRRLAGVIDQDDVVLAVLCCNRAVAVDTRGHLP